MFLDESLLELGRNAQLTEDGIKKAANLMLNACMDNLKKNINEASTEKAIKASFRRVNATWKKVVITLKEEGRGFLKEDGFRLCTQHLLGKQKSTNLFEKDLF
jgi:hypothetical protein